MHTISSIAHRGFSAAAPENTLAAFRKALDLKVPMIECDVRMSKGGQMMVIHDETVDRTTDGTGAVSQMTRDQLKSLDAGSWFGPEFAGEKIPTLEEVLDLVRGRARLLIEIKVQGEEDETVGMIQRMGMVNETIIASFHERVGLRIPELDSNLSFIFLYYCDHKLEEDESVHAADDAAGVNASVLGLNFRAVTPSIVKATHAANLQLFAWTVDDPHEIRRMAEMGVDLIASNKPDMLLHVLGEIGVCEGARLGS